MYNNVGVFSVPAGIAAGTAGISGAVWLMLAGFALIAVAFAVHRMVQRKAQPQP